MLPNISSSRRVSSYRNLLFVGFVACLFAISARSAQAATYVVNSIADTDDGTCDSTSCTLREAINAANANSGADTISFTVTGTILLGSALPDLSDDVAISGPGANVLAIKRDAVAGFRIFTISSGKTVTISGLTITNGFEPGTAILEFAGEGGGILNDRGATLTVSSCTISGNSAVGDGGGIFNAPGSGGFTTLTINNSTISGNSATFRGGGLFNSANDGLATMTINNSTVSDNSAAHGGGIFNLGIPHRSPIAATLMINNSTISGNSASDGVGGGIVNNGDRGTTLTIGSSILKSASGANITNGEIAGSTVTSLGYNLSSDDASAFLNQSTDQNSTDPLLGPLQNNGGPTFTHALLNGSLALNKGKNFTTFTTDQRGPGFARTVGAADVSGGDGTDIGAFETQPNTAPTANNDGYTTNEDTPLSDNVLTNDTDPENDTLSASLVSGPSHAQSFTLNANGTFNYTPATNFNGSDSFTYKANDGALDSDVATVSITITPVNDGPTVVVARGGSCTDAPVISGTMNLTVADVESPAGSLTLSGSSNNTSLVPNANIVFGGSGANRTIQITVAPKKSGTATVTVVVSDGQAVGTVTITVIVGSDKNETLNGTAGADMIFGLGGKNTINGFAGNDLICGGNGVDTISGGDGDDTIDGGNGDDVINGDAGNDILMGGAGNDTLNGGADNDVLTGGSGADAFIGGTGTDVATDFTPSQGDTQNGIP